MVVQALLLALAFLGLAVSAAFLALAMTGLVFLSLLSLLGQFTDRRRRA